MSELKRIVREFGRQVDEAEARTAKTLGEVADAIRLTDKERQDQVNLELVKVKEGAELIATAVTAIMKILEEKRDDTETIITQVDRMKQLRLKDAGKPTLITDNSKDGTNG